MKKRFDRDLYDTYDNVAKNGALRYLADVCAAQELRPHSDRYGADVEYIDWRGRSGKLEAEVKAVWTGGDFPYSDINVLGRKEKYFAAGTDLFMMAANYQDYLVIRGSNIIQCPLVEVANRYVWKGEKFFKVPIKLATFGRFETPVDTAPPLCDNCCMWQGYAIGESTWVCVGCAHEQEPK